MMNQKRGPGGPPEFDRPTGGEERLIQLKLRAAGRVLLFEKLWPRVWLPLSIAGVFILLSVVEVWQFLPPRLHLAMLFGFGVASVLSLLPLLFWRRPSPEEAFERLERASAIRHRPLTAFTDRLSGERLSSEALALWAAHRMRAAQALSKLKAGMPHPRIDKYDPFALRAALILLLAAGASWAWGDIGNKVRAAFVVPEVPAGASFRIDVWVSPPPYTHKEPFVLPESFQAKGPVSVPQGSLVTVKINAPDAGGYHVVLKRDTGLETVDLDGQSGTAYAEYARKLESSAVLTVRRGFGSERSWTLEAVPDRLPTIAFTGPVEFSQRGVMLFKYKAEDDYGVANAEARIERIPMSGNGGSVSSTPQIGATPIFPLSLPHAPTKSAEGKTYRDLTAHPWAGLPAVITLLARDEAGHEGRSAPRGIILPERKFTKPLAKAIIGQRRSLVEDPGDSFRIANNLNALAISGEDDNVEPAVYLNLRSAYWRLRSRHTVEDVENIVDQLWDAALRLEDGNIPAAERDLRAAQDKLKDALESGAPPEEIQKLMSELRQALSRYLQALVQQKDKNGRSAAGQGTKTISPQDLQKLLNKIEALTKSGSPEAAAKMLSELRDILESLQAGQSGGAGSAQDAEKMKQLDELTNLMRQQQQLVDQTFRAQQDGTGSPELDNQGSQGRRPRSGSNGQGGAGQTPGGLKQRQDSIQSQLQDLLSGMPSGSGQDAIKRKLEEAEGSMGEAGDALGQNDLGEAGDQEGRALEALRQGARGLAEQLMRGQGGQGAGSSMTNRDPLGRLQDNQLIDPGDSVKVPDEITVQRARQILDELRKRLGEPSRPAIELDYLERLVKPY